MPPRVRSRHLFTFGFRDVLAEREELELSDREPFVFAHYPDNRVHTVAVGDSLGSLAARYFSGIPDAAELWWVIADFQPDPILDPTIALVPGQELVIPSVRTVLESVFGQSRRAEAP